MRGLVVEDEGKVAEFISRGLQAENFTIDVASNGDAGWDFASRTHYDFIILDLMLPGLSGTMLLERLRQKGNQTPILVLTARDTTEDKVRHIQMGADDYVTKPFAFAELAVRVRALLRRSCPPPPKVLAVADLELVRDSQLVRRAGKRIELTFTEYALLEYLMTHTGRVLSRSLILEHVWDQSFQDLTNVVDVHVRHLRAKIDDPFPKKLIWTVRRVGYCLEDRQE